MSIGGINTLSTLNNTQNAINSSIHKLATGSKHPSASYGPSDYAIVQRMNSNIGAIGQSNQNTQTANSMLNVAAGATENVVSSLSSLKEQLLKAANGTNSDSDRAALQDSVNQTIASINQTAQGATYNGMQLLNGSQSVTVAGAEGYDTVNLGNLSAEGLGLTDSQGNSTIDITDQSSISSALETVNSALETALGQATDIGAAQQGMEYQSANYVTQQENLYDASSTLDDTDMAAEITKLKGANVQQQFALYATQMNMHNRANVLSLLQQ